LALDAAHLDHDEPGTGTISTGKVDGALIAGDIEALDTTGASLKGTCAGSSEQKGYSSDLHDDIGVLN
jgi:hypothetical protein